MDTLESLKANCVINEITGCWLWKWALNDKGYAVVHRRKIRSAIIRVHRITYELFHGPIPDGLEPDHTCKIKRCINPEHLEAVTHSENLRRSKPDSCPL